MQLSATQVAEAVVLDILVQVELAGTASHGGGAGSDTDGVAGAVGTTNTGGGGGGSRNNPPVAGAGAGGSGVVVIKKSTNECITTTGADMTLQSTDVTAESSPTYGEFVTLNRKCLWNSCIKYRH